MAVVYLGLGSNLGRRDANIRTAIELLKERVSVEKISSVIETDPVGGVIQDKFLNAVLKGRTELTAIDLLNFTHSIEQRLGRVRTIKDGPRTIDIDILLYDNLKITTDQLTIPHPRMMERDFVLKPLREIEPELLTRMEKNS